MTLTFVDEAITVKEIQKATRIPRIRIEQLISHKLKGDYIRFKHLLIKIKEL